MRLSSPAGGRKEAHARGPDGESVQDELRPRNCAAMQRGKVVGQGRRGPAGSACWALISGFKDGRRWFVF